MPHSEVADVNLTMCFLNEKAITMTSADRCGVRTFFPTARTEALNNLDDDISRLLQLCLYTNDHRFQFLQVL